jgi:DNA repair protein RecN (Recombination protein N)
MNHQKLHLKSLSLNNFATFQQQDITFKDNFNAIVGETGSGKSLILDSLQMIFGQRADKKLIRKDSEFATIEATFATECPEIKEYFHSIGHPFEENEIIVKRIIYSSGSSKSFLNFQACQLSTLSNFSKRFIDLVGQFDNQKLLSEDYQLVLLDSFSELQDDCKNYKNIYSQILELTKNIKQLKSDQILKTQKEDYFKFQIEEINALSPSLEDESELNQKKELILNKEKHQQTMTELSYLFTDSNNSIVDSLKKSVAITNGSDLITEENQSKIIELLEISEDLSYSFSLDNNFEYQESDLEDVLERLDTYSKLKRKFGGSIESLLQQQKEFEQELSEINQFDEQVQVAEKKLFQLTKEAKKLALAMHKVRSSKAKVLSKELSLAIRSLKMVGATINIEVKQSKELGPHGMSEVSFYAETNPGEGYYLIKDIASGGELSRILLGLRQILSSTDSISVFLFDEIDTGIGGETALSIGQALAKVSRSSQVIAITHLPQIANAADKLIIVNKETSNQRTQSYVEEINSITKEAVVQMMAPVQ